MSANIFGVTNSGYKPTEYCSFLFSESGRLSPRETTASLYLSTLVLSRFQSLSLENENLKICVFVQHTCVRKLLNYFEHVY